MQQPSSPRRRSRAVAGLTVAAALAATGFTVANASTGDPVAEIDREAQLVAEVRADQAPEVHSDAWLRQVGEYVELESARQYAIALYGRALDWQAAEAYARAAAAEAAEAEAAASYSGGAGGHLAAIRACESSGDYGAVSSSGTYRGAYQFDQQTWESVGGSGDPAAASPAEQDMRAQMLYEQRGSSPWPVCGS